MYQNPGKRIINPSILFAVLLGFSSTTFANPIDYYYKKYYEHQAQAKYQYTAKQMSSIQEGYFNQFIDHAKYGGAGTFKQRYFIDETFSTSNDDPVFYYICGEWECSRNDLMGAIRTHAQKFHAKLVTLEHRYYGVSLPRKTFSTEDLKFLSTEQALADLAYFQIEISNEKHWTGKWIAFGGSYPGSLSAYYRSQYPNMVVGAIASSAPVMAKENFEEYDAHVTQVTAGQCADNMRAATQQVEAALHDKTRLSEIKRMFAASDVRDDTDFLSVLAEVSAGAVQYGMADTFCETLAQGRTPLEGFARAARNQYEILGVKPVDLVAQGAESENPANYRDGAGMRQWAYQSCREYGYWQTANADPNKSSRSAMLDLNYYRNICHRLFGIDNPTNGTYINEIFYKPLLDAPTSKIFFTNGSNDPWSELSMTTANGNTTNPDLNYYLIDGTSHVADMRRPKESDSASLKSARVQTDELIAKWLS